MEGMEFGQDDETEEVSHDNFQVEKEEGAIQTNEGEAPEISLHVIVELLNPRTMIVMEKVKGKPVVTLMDTGSTHNFLDPTIIPKAQLSPKVVEQMEVRVANWKLVQNCEKIGRCQNFTTGTSVQN